MLRKMVLVVAALVTIGGAVALSSTEASARWWFSRMATIVRPTATAVPLSVCTGSFPRPPRIRTPSRLAW